MIAALPLTIAASLRKKKNPLAPRVEEKLIKKEKFDNNAVIKKKTYWPITFIIMYCPVQTQRLLSTKSVSD